MKISFVVPCFNEENNIEAFYNRVLEVMLQTDYEYEIVFVNDGSKDKTRSVLRNIYQSSKIPVTVISFSRNFGKESAMLAGMKRAKGEYTTIIDVDLQQEPLVVLEMVTYLEENEDCDCVAAYQDRRHEGKVLTLYKKMFYHMINRISDTKLVADASDFRTMRTNVKKAILSMPEYHRFSKGIFSWVGFETHYIPYTVHERHAGTSKWSFRKLFSYAVEGIIAFSTFPLKIATFLGGITSVMAIVYLIVVLVQKLAFGISIPGYPTIIGLILLIGGIQLSILGVFGEYLSRTYIQGKNRPIYIEKEVLEREDENGGSVDE